MPAFKNPFDPAVKLESGGGCGHHATKSAHDADPLVTNGPSAKIAEVVVNTLPRNRTRHDMHRHPHYYRIRNHLIEFLVDRSRTFDQAAGGGNYDPRTPPIVTPGVQEENRVGDSPRAHG